MRDEILIIGARGFIGAAVRRGLVASGANVTGTSRAPDLQDYTHLEFDNPHELSEILRLGNFRSVILSIGDIGNSVITALDNREFRNIQRAFVSAMDELQMLSHLIILGSASEYGRSRTPFSESSVASPIDIYGRNKLRESLFFLSLREHGVPTTILRPSSVFGPFQRGGMLAPLAVSAIKSKSNLEILSPRSVRDFLHVDDLASAIEKMVKSERPLPEILNVSSGRPVTAHSFVESCVRLSRAPTSLMNYKTNEQDDEVNRDELMLDSSLIREEIDWQPKYSLISGLASMLSVEGLM